MLYDKDIREPLFDFIEEKFGKTRIFEEKRMGESRADVFVITEHNFIGIEIKSDADTYVRLESQVKDYDLYYDYNYIVAGGRHGAHVSKHVPSYWGIITVEEIDGKADFYILREACLNPNVSVKNKLSILWRPELSHIQELNQMHKYKDKSKAFVIEKICAKVENTILSKQICDELFERDYSTIADKIADYRKNNNLRKRKAKRVSKRYKITKI